MKLTANKKDVVEQLRELAWMDEAHSSFIYEEAADEIERLRARVAELEAIHNDKRDGSP